MIYTRNFPFRIIIIIIYEKQIRTENDMIMSGRSRVEWVTWFRGRAVGGELCAPRRRAGDIGPASQRRCCVPISVPLSTCVYPRR